MNALGMKDIRQIANIASDITAEALAAREKFGPMTSAHEGYALILEELDELWDHVKKKHGERDLAAMQTEAIQIAAMALCFAADVCNEERGRV